ncbi:MAG: succinylglutamate desuccinylase/aspartoacylase family protein [Kiloniellales bacterium]
MPRQTEQLPLIPAAAGSGRVLALHRFGATGARPKAYLQAALHADETPGLLVLHHLLSLLEAVQEADSIRGEIVVAPYANPIGLSQFVNGVQLGRYAMIGSGNFNRNWPDLYTPIAEGLGNRLGDDAEANKRAIRAAMRAHIEDWEPQSELESLRRLLAREAADADYVFDLHCDDEALLHLFLVPQHWPLAEPLAAELGVSAVLLAEDSGGSTFDETFSGPWLRLAARYPGRPIPPACLSTTVELRGRSDVDDKLAIEDAAALYRSLQRFGVVAGDPGPQPRMRCEATGLDATDTIRSPVSGVVAYRVALGATVEAGDIVAEIVNPAAPPKTARTPVATRASGLVLSRRSHRYVAAGMVIAKVVGREPLPHRQGGALLDD